MIDGVGVIPLKQIADARGKVMHMLRSDAPHFRGFGEIYFSTVVPGAVKAWHFHKTMMLNYAVPVGAIRLVLFDDRTDSRTHGEVQEMILGSANYNLVAIPAMVWSGFQGISSEVALVANCTTLPHDPTEIERRDPNDRRIPYDWDRGRT